MIRIVKHDNWPEIDKDLQWVSLILTETGNVSLIALMERVPVHIVDSDYMKKHIDPETSKFIDWNPDYIPEYVPERDAVMPPTEVLGVYFPQYKSPVTNYVERAIFICPERIQKCAINDTEYTYLLAKVTIHEFCHAYMDIHPGSGNYNEFKGFWMEESMANVMTLQVIDTYTIKLKKSIEFFEFALEFISRQPSAYKFAREMWKYAIKDYDLWAWNKTRFIKSSNVTDWVNEASKNQKIILALWSDIKKEMEPKRVKNYLIVKFEGKLIASYEDASEVFKGFVEEVGINRLKSLNLYRGRKNPIPLIVTNIYPNSPYRWLELKDPNHLLKVPHYLLGTSSTEEKLDFINEIIRKLGLDAEAEILQ